MGAHPHETLPEAAGDAGADDVEYYISRSAQVLPEYLIRLQYVQDESAGDGGGDPAHQVVPTPSGPAPAVRDSSRPSSTSTEYTK